MSSAFVSGPDYCCPLAVRAADVAHVYRRHQPTYTRSHVGFMGPDRLAMTMIEDGRSRVRVLTMPRG